ncbi:hypothetical protein Scep_007461 [Stephania cephalantha]|uniref:Uncharacterized protein n=1 Tax=Stephania cephalantha TaxID=152367 RepID=A0AAP0PNA0_9MAGN
MGGYEPSVDGDRDGDVGDIVVGGDSYDDGITQSMGDFEFLVSTPPRVEEVNEEGDHVKTTEEVFMSSV